ncbi:Receptor protein-tyrosine kinase cepr1 [Castilleja foliolosa]|uniref:Receptor protein-tyrosine kinase cepr1 n=1 Tax=Castilleja foliolosa TaxID=1961234 RepID=A0ABD3CWK8_9LAMI
MSFNYFILVLILSLHTNSSQANPTAQFFDLIGKSASGDSLTNWKLSNNNNYCNFTGIVCDGQQNIVVIDITGWTLTGKFPDQICLYLPRLRILRIGHNSFDSQLPRGITNCSSLQELNVTHAFFTGPLPDFSPLKKTLKILDLSYNHFSGNFPISITNLTGLETLDLNENIKLNPWTLPDAISDLTSLEALILTTCMLHGKIPTSLGNMTSLTDLELSGNYLTGRVPTELARLKNLKLLELYYNQLDGNIPDEIGNLTSLHELDMSVNRLTGQIPKSICRLPNIRVFQLYNNSLTGEIPNVLANSTTLITLSLYANYLTGPVPPNLGRSSALVGVDLSENRLTGKLPEDLCSGGKLKYLLFLQNFLSGEIPESYAECESLIRFRVSSNNLSGKIPGRLFSLPHASIIDIEKNDLTGSIPGESIRNAKNLSELFMQGNRISGLIPPEISLATKLVKIDLSNNFLSGPIPSKIGNLRWLNLLLLQNNELSSSIPESLSSLKSLNVLDLSSNRLTGRIPESLDILLPNSLNFSNNRLSGEIPIPFIKGGVLESFAGNPSLCVAAYKNTSYSNFSICPQAYDRKKINSVWLIGVLIFILIIGTVLFLRKWYSKNKRVYENEDHTMSSSFFSYEMKSFHRLSFDQREIIDAMVDKNIVGYGGSGAVYRVEINNGAETVAVKKLWGRTISKDADDNPILDRELKTEVETLGSIRHKNIVKLYCYFSGLDCSLLVYEYMTNGNLWDTLHGGTSFLDWPIRHQIALGVAQGLAYLHHDLAEAIVHRDIKSTNILLDVDYLPKVADFGIAKVLQARGSKDSVTSTVIAGTYGYLAPEYAYSSKATTKCDVYSFGVVLMELLTGKKPVEPEFGDNKNIISWVSTKVETKEGATDVLDKRVLGTYGDDMIKVLRIAIRCTCRTPNLRPTMNEVVQLLMEADPCKFDCCKFSKKDKEIENCVKIKDQFEL